MGSGCSCGDSSALTNFPSKGKQDPTYAQAGAAWEPKEGTMAARRQHPAITTPPPPSFNEILLCPILERGMLGLEAVTMAGRQGH